LNGVDNGRIWFKNVRVPRDNLLNHFADISANGTYTSELKTPEERFAVSIGALVGGRVFMAGGVQTVARLALSIAIRYGLSRRQFGEGRQETLIMDYPLHQRRLMPLLANLFVFAASATDIKNLWLRERASGVMKQVHLVAAGVCLVSYLVLANPSSVETVSNMELICNITIMSRIMRWSRLVIAILFSDVIMIIAFGTINRIGVMKNDLDVWLTFEGDNFVLLQQVSRFLLKVFND